MGAFRLESVSNLFGGGPVPPPANETWYQVRRQRQGGRAHDGPHVLSRGERRGQRWYRELGEAVQLTRTQRLYGFGATVGVGLLCMALVRVCAQSYERHGRDSHAPGRPRASSHCTYSN
jgi:hypothetical protein